MNQPTQNELLEAEFRRRPGEWIEMPELAVVITPTGIGAAVHSRVSDLRTKHGMTIEHRNYYCTIDGVGRCCSEYRLITDLAGGQSLPVAEPCERNATLRKDDFPHGSIASFAQPPTSEPFRLEAQ